MNSMKTGMAIAAVCAAMLSMTMMAMRMRSTSKGRKRR